MITRKKAMKSERGRLYEIPLLLMALSIAAAFLLRHPFVYLSILWPVGALVTWGLGVSHRWHGVPAGPGLYLVFSLATVPLMVRVPITLFMLVILVAQAWLSMVLAYYL